MAACKRRHMRARPILRDAFLRYAKKCSSESDSLVMPVISGPCETPGKHTNAREEDPRLRAGDRLLEVFGEAPAPVEPGECAFNHPAFSLSLEGPHTLGSRNDLNRPLAELRDRVEQLVAAVN